MNCLITGATGFVGPYLIRQLLDARAHITTIADRSTRLPRGVRFIRADITKLRPRDLKGLRPDVVFHLAAISNVPISTADPLHTFRINTLGTACLFRALEARGIRCRIVFVGSSLMYAQTPKPMVESTPIRPGNPYAASKACAEAISLAWAARGSDIVVLRPFNHTGPGQSTDFVAPSFAAQIALAESGAAPPVVRVGDLGAIRDFTDVRDMARAYVLAAERAKSGRVYNISSDRGTSIRDLLDTLLSFARKRIRVVSDASRRRDDRTNRLVGCSRRFRKATGWKPRIPFRRTLQDLLDYHRRQV